MKNTLALISKIYEKGNRFIVEELKKNGADELVPSRGGILVCLYEQNKMTMKDIANKINRTKSTVSVLAAKLEKLNYIKREISQDDNRCTYIVLTRKGKDFKPVFEKISNELNNMLLKNLSDSEVIILEKLLKKIVN